jgi:hypothetical protein
MRFNLFPALAIFISACSQNSPKVTLFKTSGFVLADTSYAATDYLEPNNYCSGYPVYFVGAPADTLYIGQPYSNEWGVPHYLKAPLNYNYTPQALKFIVDTLAKSNVHLNWYSYDGKDQPDSNKNYHAFIFSIQNISDSHIYLGNGFELEYITREAKDAQGNWIKVDNTLNEMGICGTGSPRIFLAPQELLIAKLKRYKGNFVTDFRLRLGIGDSFMYSNTFRDSIDLKTLQQPKRGI